MDIFYLKLILAFTVGALWITSATVIAERFGTKIGGIITGIPSTIVVSLFFIGWTQSPQIASTATGIVPAIMGLDALFTALYIVLSKNKLYVSIGLPLLLWFVLSYFFVFLKLDNFFLSLTSFAILFIFSYVLLEKMVKVKSQGQRKVTLNIKQISFRALLSGTIIACAVIMTKAGGPVWGGVFASFPAIMLSTMVITYLAQGRNFSVAIMKVVMVSGSINVVIYSTAIRYLYPVFGLIPGTVYSFMISLLTSYLMYEILKRRMS